MQTIDLNKNLSNLNLVQLKDFQSHSLIPSPPTLRKWIKSGKFPQPTRLSHSCLVWQKSEIDQWFANQQKSGV